MSSVDEAGTVRRADPLTFVARAGALALAYFAAGRFGIEQDVAHGVITPVWAPTGIAIAALLLWGRSYWVGVTLAAFLVNSSGGASIGASAGIAVGNTLEAVVAATLLLRVGFSPSLVRVRDVLWFVALAAVAATTISATIGLTSLTIFDDQSTGRFGQDWLLWWFGDLIGALLVAPPIMTFAEAIRRRRRPQRTVEAVFLLCLLVGASVDIFIGGNWKYPYFIFPLLMWAALRFEQVGATLAVLIVGGIATWGTANGAVPIGGATETQAVQILQALIAIVGVSVFVTAATIAERDTAERERARALTELRDRNEMYETLLHAVSDLGEGFIVTDAGKLVFANPAYCRMTGYSYEELLELPSLLQLTAPEQRQEISARLRERLAGGKVVDHYEAALIRKDGGRVECEVAVEVANTDQGPRIVSVVRDVTERKRIESFRENFVSYAAHELRTPIAVISGFVELLERPENLNPEEGKPLLERVTANVRMMKTRVDNILALTRLQRGDVRLEAEEVELGTALREITDGAAPPPGKTVSIEVTPGTTAWVDRSALDQIVANLVTNALRYGGPQVRVSARPHQAGVLLAVSDNGMGISTEEVERMFEPFTRGTAAGAGEGAGLGLTIVRALVEASGGTIDYAHRDGAATFSIRLPGA